MKFSISIHGGPSLSSETQVIERPLSADNNNESSFVTNDYGGTIVLEGWYTEMNVLQLRDLDADSRVFIQLSNLFNVCIHFAMPPSTLHWTQLGFNSACFIDKLVVLVVRR